MNRFKTKIVGLATAILLSAGALIAPLTSSAVTIDELMAQIAVLQAQLLTLQGSSASTADKCSFTRSLTVGSRGDDVTCLQNYLTGTGYFTFSGGATGYFGSITRTAVSAWQSANGVYPPAGYFGSISRAKYDSLMATVVSSSSSVASSAGSSSSVVATGEGLTITSATQPAATLAVKSAARLPYTKVTLTAGAQDVVVTGITVERTGLANDAAFSGVVLLDETGIQLGIAKTFNSDHKATVGETVTIKAGTSKTFTVAGNMASDQTSYAGQVAYLSVTGVTTSATVSGSLPISGAGHTINNSLTIGSVTMAVGANDPQNSPSKEIGSTGYTFSGVKITAGSAEKIRVKSIRWNQSGSAAAADLSNIKTYVDGTAYDTVVSSDGKYFTSTFGDGIVVDKGGNIQASIKGDISGGSGRTIDFDVYKTTDIAVTGETYGYGITPPNGADDSGTDDSAFHASTNPWYDASQVTVSSGTLTVEKASTVAAQNIAINVTSQPLGGFTVEAKGEPVSVASMVFRLSSWAGTGATASTQDITNISLVDENGTVVAGPVDIAATAATVTFTDTITFPVGKKTYTLKGKVGTDFANNQTIAASTTPSTDWTTVTGQTTGNSITPSPTSAITANTMTIKSAVMTISVSASPASQSVVAGAQNYVFANLQFDATASGEDIKFSTIPLTFTNGGTASYITGCTLYDNSTALNSGSNTVTGPTATPTFTLDNNLTIPKGTVKAIALKCNIAGSATTSSTFLFGIPAAASWSGTGVTSSQSATITATAASSGTMTVGAGSFTVALDSSSPSYYLAAANTTGNTAAILKFHANNEAINLQKVSLQLTNPSASSSPNDIVKVTLWDGSTQVGEAIFTGSNRNATSTLTGTVTIPKDGDKLLTVKTDLADIGSTGIGTQGAFVAVDYNGTDSTGTQGVGQSSGGTVNQGSTGDTASSGFRVVRSYPTIARVALTSNTLNNGSLITLARFKVTANSTGDVGLYKFTVKIATTTASVAAVNAYAYTDSGFSQAVSGIGASGKMLNTDLTMNTLWADSNTQLSIYPQTTAAASTTIQVPAGGSRYFDIVGNITGATTGASVSTQVEGDAAYASSDTLMSFYNTLDTDTHNDFIWSPNATTSSTLLHRDWTNGYGVSGLPAANLTAEVLSK